ncbi:hypothetical protein HDU98_003850 [Podochytrium sp. JEL0797]|nr:hypothetical protein HDU98_003850 [Podochytrium sp. JEL0797]
MEDAVPHKETPLMENNYPPYTPPLDITITAIAASSVPPLSALDSPVISPLAVSDKTLSESSLHRSFVSTSTQTDLALAPPSQILRYCIPASSLSRRDSPSSMRTSIASGDIDDTDDPAELKSLLRVSRSANKKLEASTANLQRQVDAMRTSCSGLQKTLTSERDSRYLVEKAASETAKKREFAENMEKQEREEELVTLRISVRVLQEEVEELKFKVCDTCHGRGAKSVAPAAAKPTSTVHPAPVSEDGSESDECDELESANDTISSIGNDGSPMRRCRSSSESPHTMSVSSSNESLDSGPDIEFEIDPAAQSVSAQFYDQATARLTQEFNNKVGWQTVAMDLAEIVLEFENKKEANPSGIGDEECVNVIIESIVRVVEMGIQNAAGVKPAVEKFFDKLPGLEKLLAKYGLTELVLIQILEKTCVTAPFMPPKKLTTATRDSYRPLMFLPIIMRLYAKDLVDVNSILDWHDDLEDALAHRQEALLDALVTDQLVEIHGLCAGFVEWLGGFAERNIGEKEKEIDAKSESDEAEDSDTEESEVEWDDDSDLFDDVVPVTRAVKFAEAPVEVVM